jgi:hypothetical protein
LKNFIYRKHKSFISSIILVSTFLFLNSSFSYSQTRVDSLEYLGRMFKTNLFDTRFDKQLNTYYLNSKFQLFETMDDFMFRINENFASTYIRSQTQNTRDEQNLNFNLKYHLNDKIYWGILGNSSILSDNRSLGINESTVNYITLYSELRPINDLRLNPFGGYSNNSQVGIKDDGFVYGIEGSLDALRISDLQIDSDLRYKNEDILPRRNLLRYFELDVSNRFERSVSNTLRTLFTQSRKDFYFDADSITAQEFNINKNLQSRTETAYHIQDRLFYDQFLDIFSLDLSGGINWRGIDRNTRYKIENPTSTSPYDTRIEELKLEFDAVTRYTSRLFNLAFRLNYYERDEKNTPKKTEGVSDIVYDEQLEKESQKNNNSARAVLSLSGNYKISPSDDISFSLYQSKLRYDTPSTLNDDDRDEILSIVRLGYLIRLNSYFNAFINFEGTYGHTVYLFARKSSNNNENRILRLRSGGYYGGTLIKSFNSFEVSANYTVYDFESLVSNYHSYSFRQFTAVDSTTLSLTKKIDLFNYAYVKLSEIGDFNWDNFSARPTRYLKEIYIEPRLILNIDNSFFSAGIRFFLLDTYGYVQNVKILESDFQSIGPITIIDLFLWKKLSLIFRGYYEFISNTNSPKKEQANLTMQVNWKF